VIAYVRHERGFAREGLVAQRARALLVEYQIHLCSKRAGARQLELHLIAFKALLIASITLTHTHAHALTHNQTYAQQAGGQNGCKFKLLCAEILCKF